MKTFQQFIEEAIDAANRVIRLKDVKPPHITIPANFTKPGEPDPKGNTRHIFKDASLPKKNDKVAQLAPPKATNTGVKGDPLNTIILDNPGKKLYRLQQAVKAKGSVG